MIIEYEFKTMRLLWGRLLMWFFRRRGFIVYGPYRVSEMHPWIYKMQREEVER